MSLLAAVPLGASHGAAAGRRLIGVPRDSFSALPLSTAGRDLRSGLVGEQIFGDPSVIMQSLGARGGEVRAPLPKRKKFDEGWEVCVL